MRGTRFDENHPSLRPEISLINIRHDNILLSHCLWFSNHGTHMLLDRSVVEERLGDKYFHSNFKSVFTMQGLVAWRLTFTLKFFISRTDKRPDTLAGVRIFVRTQQCVGSTVTGCFSHILIFCCRYSMALRLCFLHHHPLSRDELGGITCVGEHTVVANIFNFIEAIQSPG